MSVTESVSDRLQSCARCGTIRAGMPPASRRADAQALLRSDSSWGSATSRGRDPPAGLPASRGDVAQRGSARESARAGVRTRVAAPRGVSRRKEGRCRAQAAHLAAVTRATRKRDVSLWGGARRVVRRALRLLGGRGRGALGRRPNFGKSLVVRPTSFLRRRSLSRARGPPE
jgi:hypothetical protein